MKLEFASLAAVLLLGCSGSREVLTGDAEQRGPAAAQQPKGGFQPVPRKQPTEGGAWVVDPSDPLTLYALGKHSMRTRDGGHTWEELAWPSGAESLAFSQAVPPAMYLRTNDPSTHSDTLLESRDGGESWTDVHAALPAAEVVVVDEPEGPVLLASRPGYLGEGVDDTSVDGYLARSTDRGATWTAAVAPPASGPLPLQLGQLLVANGERPGVYVGAIASTSVFESVVLVSSDAGATFVAKSLPLNSSAGLPHLSLDCQGRLYYSIDTSLYRSSDAGSSWESIGELDAEAFGLRVLSGGKAGCDDSIYASGSTKSGQKLWHFEDGTVTSRELAGSGELLDLGDERLLLVETFGPRRRSDDGGRSWWTAGVALDSGDLVVSPASAGLLFVSKVGSVYRSEDDGETWLEEPQRTAHDDLYPDPYDSDVLYARSVYGDDSPWSFVSMDGGRTFRDWPVPNAQKPEVPEAMMATAPGELTVATRGGVYATRDAGAHFTTLLRLPASQQIMWATISSSRPPAIYAYVGHDDDLQVHEMLGSVDGGATWTSSDPGTYTTALVVDPADSHVVLAAAGFDDDNGTLRTLNGGGTWERLAGRGTLAFDPLPPYSLYAIGNQLLRSQDRGTTWRTIADLPDAYGDFELDPNQGRARYLLSRRGLLYKMTE